MGCMTEITEPVVLDRTGVRIAEALEEKGANKPSRVISLCGTPLRDGSKVIEAIGIPVYVDDVSKYEAYGLTDTGWYIFARIKTPACVRVSGVTEVTGANAIVTAGAAYVDVAVRFDVAALAKAVTVNWDGMIAETFVFRASDLAIRNLDYRVTFYIYDAAPYATWEYAPTEDQTFQAGKNYYISDGEGGYTLAEVQTVAYVLTSDETFQAGKTYYISDGAGGYTAATVTAGEAVTANTYYEQTTVPVPAIYYEAVYNPTADETFQSGKTYYVLSEGTYVTAEVTVGEAVPADTFFELSYILTEDATFVDGKTYYTKSGTTYTAAEVTAGDALPTVYYNHSKCIISGLVRNVTYKLDAIIDCPMEFILPEIEDETHGCWFEIRCRHAGEYSMTLTPPSADVKIATEHTQKETAGINMINLHYTVIDGLKIWRFLNTHSSIPTT